MKLRYAVSGCTVIHTFSEAPKFLRINFMSNSLSDDFRGWGLEALEGFPWSNDPLVVDTAPRLGGAFSFAESFSSNRGPPLSSVAVCWRESEGTATLVMLDFEEGGCCDEDADVGGLEAVEEYGPGAVRGLNGREWRWGGAPGTLVRETVFSLCVGWEVGLKHKLTIDFTWS